VRVRARVRAPGCAVDAPGSRSSRPGASRRHGGPPPARSCCIRGVQGRRGRMHGPARTRRARRPTQATRRARHSGCGVARSGFCVLGVRCRAEDAPAGDAQPLVRVQLALLWKLARVRAEVLPARRKCTRTACSASLCALDAQRAKHAPVLARAAVRGDPDALMALPLGGVLAVDHRKLGARHILWPAPRSGREALPRVLGSARRARTNKRT
jgi:hypothetical protein